MARADYGREMGSGRYTWTQDALCTCGHRLGIHSAARTKTADGGSEQPCFNGDPNDGDGTPCDCRCFTKAKPQRRGR